MRWFVLVLVIPALAACLVVEKKNQPTDTHGGQDVSDDSGSLDQVGPDAPGPDDDTADTWGPDAPTPDAHHPDTTPPDVTPDVTPDTPVDVTPEEVTPLCPGLGIDSFAEISGKRYVVFGETATLAGEYHAAAANPMVNIEVTPPSMAQFYDKTGPATGIFKVVDVPLDFATTEVTITLTVSDASCFEQRSAKLKVLGNVWVAETSADVVQVFRSDGVFLQQGIGSTFLEDPYELIQLAPDRIGVGNRFKGGVEIFDLEGTHVGAFQTEDNDGTYLYSVYGAYAMITHRPNGHIWVGGVRGQILDYAADGIYKKTIWVNDYSTGDLNPRDLLQLPDDTVLAIQDTTLDWGFFLFDNAGKYIGDWGDNANELELEVNRMALTPDNRVVVAGKVGYPTNKGYLTLLKLGGQMVKRSPPIAEFTPNYGLVAFGEGFLTVGEVPATNDTPIASFDNDLNVVNAAWHGEKTGSYRGLIVLGGN